MVIGLGRFGSALALEPTSRTPRCWASAADPGDVRSMSGRLSHVTTADSTDIEALRQLGSPTPTARSWPSEPTSTTWIASPAPDKPHRSHA
ncbi:hypothetical protein [Micromonospora sp. NBC_01740]|uniref:hypothetical protein n=1 Tax=Micromonospora sp. NBC_01740 TaxID=2975986 RepID=UPI003FA39A7B